MNYECLYIRRRGAFRSPTEGKGNDSIACDERNFSSSEERDSAPLGLSPPKGALSLLTITLQVQSSINEIISELRLVINKKLPPHQKIGRLYCI